MNDFYRPTHRWWAALLLVLGVQVSMPTLAQEYQEIPDPTSDSPYNPGGAPAASSSQGTQTPDQNMEAARRAGDEAFRQYQEEQRQNMEALIHGIGEVMRKKVAEKEKKEKEEEKDDAGEGGNGSNQQDLNTLYKTLTPQQKQAIAEELSKLTPQYAKELGEDNPLAITEKLKQAEERLIRKFAAENMKGQRQEAESSGDGHSHDGDGHYGNDGHEDAGFFGFSPNEDYHHGDYYEEHDHAGVVGTVAVTAIGTIASVALGTTIGAAVGAAAGGAIGGSVGGVVGGAAGAVAGTVPPPPPPSPGTPPSSPDFPNLPDFPEDPEDSEDPENPGTEPDPEDEKTDDPVPPTEDPGKFTPTNYPDYCNQFIRQQSDGDVVMKSPATGQDVRYYSNGDGTWFSDSGMTYTKEDIEERLRFEAENAGYVRQNAETAERNVAEQRAQWEEQNARDLERGYSDEMKEFRDWMAEQERAEQKQEKIEKLAEQYHVEATEKAVKDAIKWDMLMNEMDSRTYRLEAGAWEEKEEYLKTVDKTAEIGVNVLANVAPGGSHVKNAYTFAKSTLVGVSEAVAEGKEGFEAVRHVSVRMGEGALGVIQNEAGNITEKYGGSWKMEYGINIATEGMKSGMKEYNDSGGDGFKAIKAGLSGIGSKTVEFGITKGISAGFDTLKEGSKDYVDYAKKGMVPDDDAGYKVMSKLNNFLNGEVNIQAGPKVTTYKVDVSPGNADGGKIIYSVFEGKNVKDAANASLKVVKDEVFTLVDATVDKGKLAETIVTETLSQVKFGEGDDAKNIYELTGGQYGESVADFGKEISDLSQTAAKYAQQNAKK